jgi:hypothetical protein
MLVDDAMITGRPAQVYDFSHLVAVASDETVIVHNDVLA